MAQNQLVMNECTFLKYIKGQNVASNITEVKLDYGKTNEFRMCYFKKITKKEIENQICTIKLKYLIFTPLTTHNNNIKDITDGDFIQVNFENNFVFKLYFKMLFELSEFDVRENSYILTIPSDYTIREINMTSDVDIYVPLHRTKNFDIKIGYEEKYTVLPLIAVQPLNNKKIFQMIELEYEYKWNDMQKSVDTMGFAMNKKIKSEATKGYFFLGNFSKIKKMMITFNGYCKFQFNSTQLNIHCHKITDNLYYFPYANKNNYQDSSLESFVGSAYYNDIDLVRIYLTVDVSTSDVIHIFSLNGYLN